MKYMLIFLLSMSYILTSCAANNIPKDYTPKEETPVYDENDYTVTINYEILC